MRKTLNAANYILIDRKTHREIFFLSDFFRPLSSKGTYRKSRKKGFGLNKVKDRKW